MKEHKSSREFRSLVYRAGFHYYCAMPAFQLITRHPFKTSAFNHRSIQIYTHIHSQKPKAQVVRTLHVRKPSPPSLSIGEGTFYKARGEERKESAGSRLKSHNGTSDGLRGGDEEGKILMNLASSSHRKRLNPIFCSLS